MEELFFAEFSVEEARQLNPLVLAHVGDAVYELFIRSYIVDNNREFSAHKIHLKAISYVKANSQSKIMRNIESKLTEEEMSIYKRGRNTKSYTVPKNAEVSEYRIATGFEALIGFLFLTDQKSRLKFILEECIKR